MAIRSYECVLTNIPVPTVLRRDFLQLLQIPKHSTQRNLGV